MKVQLFQSLSAAYTGLYGPKGHGVGLDLPITEFAVGNYAKHLSLFSAVAVLLDNWYAFMMTLAS